MTSGVRRLTRGRIDGRCAMSAQGCSLRVWVGSSLKAREEIRMLIWGIGIVVVLRARRVLAEGGVLGLRFRNIDRSANAGELEKFAGGVLMQAQATMCPRDRPHRTGMEPVRRHPFHPVLHGKADITVSGTRGFRALSCDDRVPFDPEPIAAGPLVCDFVCHAKVTLGRRFVRQSDCGSSDEKRLAALHDVHHAPLQRDLYDDVFRVFRLVTDRIVAGLQGKGLAARTKKGRRGGERRKFSSPELESRKHPVVKSRDFCCA